ncbi:hypothetical protein PspLS_11381 [Pyricularia sp. CBS 133598]|nr:hypothetical protein PspLS_11381 [Pyricularia sp. CBS 133598]
MVTYSPLFGSDFRLLQLRPLEAEEIQITCKLVKAALDADIRFKALSYTWGSPADTKHILLDGEQVLVTANLETCLRQLCDPTEKHWHEDGGRATLLLWVDAVCINQNDIAERSAQVLRMKKIYSSAEEVIVWLGIEAEHSQAGIACISDTVDESFRIVLEDDGQPPHVFQDLVDTLVTKFHQLLSTGTSSPGLLGIADILGREWFSRVWVLQELAMAARVSFRIGEAEIGLGQLYLACFGFSMVIARDWRGVHALTQLLSDTVEKSMSAASVMMVLTEYKMNGELWVGKMEGRADGCRGRGAFFPLETLLTTFQHQHASLPLDKVYSLLGISTDFAEGGIVPDYGLSTQQAYMEVFRAHLEKHDSLSLLSQCRGGGDAPEGIPSWVPRWNRVPESNERWPELPKGFIEGSNGTKKPTFYASKSIKLSSYPWWIDTTSKKLHLRGVLLDQIVRLTERPSLSIPAQTEEFIINYANFLLDELAPEQEVRYPLTDETVEEAAATTMVAKYTVQGGGVLTYAEATPERVVKNGRKRWCSKENPRVAMILAMYIGGWRLAVTSKEWFGLVPPETEQGDVVALLVGAPVLHVLRRESADGGLTKGQENWKLMGEAYVHGLMNGEGLKYGELRDISLL